MLGVSALRVALSLAAFALVSAAYLAAVLMLVNTIAYTIASVSSALVIRRRSAKGHKLKFCLVIQWLGGVAATIMFSLIAQRTATAHVSAPKTAAFLTLIACLPILVATYLLIVRTLMRSFMS